jgi:hypothetical protein
VSVGQLALACNTADDGGTAAHSGQSAASASAYANQTVPGAGANAPPSAPAGAIPTSPTPTSSVSPGAPDAGSRHHDPSPPPTTPPPPPPASDPCAGVVCPEGQACVSEAHGQPLGVCVDTCDCSNCGNCSYDNADGRWDDMQEYCGNLKNSPATMACNRPCGGGMGCIYYGAVNICWPLEGCFSL